MVFWTPGWGLLSTALHQYHFNYLRHFYHWVGGWGSGIAIYFTSLVFFFSLLLYKPCPGESKLQFGLTGMTPKIFFCSWPCHKAPRDPAEYWRGVHLYAAYSTTGGSHQCTGQQNPSICKELHPKITRQSWSTGQRFGANGDFTTIENHACAGTTWPNFQQHIPAWEQSSLNAPNEDEPGNTPNGPVTRKWRQRPATINLMMKCRDSIFALGNVPWCQLDEAPRQGTCCWLLSYWA